MSEHKLWVERYRPTSLGDYLFHDNNHRLAFEQMINDQAIPHLLLSGTQGCGKAQPLDAQVLTPNGWCTMEQIVPGSTVSTPSGEWARVLQTFPQGTKDIYEITFHDGSSTQACADHLWECYFIDGYKDRKATKHTVDTKSIIDFLARQEQRSSERFNVSIPLTTAIEFDLPKQNALLHPYVLGVLLGDGSMSTSSLKLTSTDTSLVERTQKLLPEGHILKLYKGTTKEYGISNANRIIYGGKLGVSENTVVAALKELGLFGCKSSTKFIPESYKKHSIEQRFELIRGLMDTDGTISSNGSNCSFSTVSKQMADDVQEILWSLGCTCTQTQRETFYTYNNERKKGQVVYTLHIAHQNGNKQFFSLERKRQLCHDVYAQNHNRGDIQLRRRIKNITYVGRKEAKCIYVDHSSHLYITDDYIVTHNTSIAQILTNSIADSNDILVINASDQNSVDVMRDKIKQFVSTISFSGDYKIVHLEEADYITPNGQGVLRRMMEEFYETARFVLTCNYENKIIPAIQSRCQHFKFKAHDKDVVTEHIARILINEKVTFTVELLDKFITAGYPDIRKIINLVQQHSKDGQLQPISQQGDSSDYKLELLDLIDKGDWLNARKTVCNQITDEWEALFRFLYDNIERAPNLKQQQNWEKAITIIADHLYKHGFVADPEINVAAMFIRLQQIQN